MGPPPDEPAAGRTEERRRAAERRAQDASRRAAAARRSAEEARTAGNARGATFHDHEAAMHQRAAELHLHAARLQVQHAGEPESHRHGVDPGGLRLIAANVRRARDEAELRSGPRVIAVALSGVLDDGTAGAGAVRRNGGLVVVQSPDDALFADIPRNIIDQVGADYVLPSSEIGMILRRLTEDEVEDQMAADDITDPALADQAALLEKAEQGAITHFTCPECSGTLWEVDEHGVRRYRCRVGHVYSPEALRAAQADGVETALWIAMRALEEQAALMRRTADRSRTLKTPAAAARLDLRAEEIDARIHVIRRLLNELTTLREQEAAATASGAG